MKPGRVQIYLRILLVVMIVTVVALTYAIQFHRKISRKRDETDRETELQHSWASTEHPALQKSDISAEKSQKQEKAITLDLKVKQKIKKNSKNFANLSSDITVVTAYFNLGSFRKGQGDYFTPALYRQWMLSFKLLTNPTIMLADKDEDLDYMRALRSGLPHNRTLIIKVNRSELWAFQLSPRITRIFDQPDYPKHHPNTVVPEYSMAMHAKYEIMQKMTALNPFKTKYFCWLDVGLFRDLTSKRSVGNISEPIEEKFELQLPPGFNTDSVAYSEKRRRFPGYTPEHIVFYNLIWVCGCIFIAEVEVMYKWTREYISGVESMLSLNLMNTDQQVIYYIFNALQPETKIQTYKSDGQYDDWFYLGYLARQQGLHHRPTE